MWKEREVVLNNPASRLFEFFKQAYDLKGDEPIRNIFAHVLGFEPNDATAISQTQTLLFSQIHQARDAIHQLNTDVEIYLGPIDALEQALIKYSVNYKWSQFKDDVTEVVMTGLLYTALFLSKKAEGQVIEEKKIDELRKEVKAMLDDVVKSSFPPQLKAMIIKHLTAIEKALINYSLGGTEALTETLDQTIGSFWRYNQVQSAEEVTKEDWELLKKVFKFIVDAGKLTGATFAITKFIEIFTPLLP